MVADKFPNGLIGPIGLNGLIGPIVPILPIFPINSTSISTTPICCQKGCRCGLDMKKPRMGST